MHLITAAAPRTGRSFGIEEEYLLLDENTGAPVDMAAQLVHGQSELLAQTEREYFSSQLETSTPVCFDAETAYQSLMRTRTIAADAASKQGVVVAGTGLPPTGGDIPGTVTPRPRYRLIQNEMRGAAAHQYGSGTHVHVNVPSRDAGIEVLTRVARWAPALLALTVNSPLWCGVPTGFASWRHIMSKSWPVAGYPLEFEDATHYERSVAQLISSGVIPDGGMLSWVIRLSDRYPTIELRIADAQLCAEDAVGFAVIFRALVDRSLTDAEAEDSRPRFAGSLVNSANWLAARNGLGSELIDTLSGEAMPAFELVDRMMHTIEGQLDRFGDLERVEGYLSKLKDKGDPASRQLDAFTKAGVPGVLRLFLDEGTS